MRNRLVVISAGGKNGRRRIDDKKKTKTRVRETAERASEGALLVQSGHARHGRERRVAAIRTAVCVVRDALEKFLGGRPAAAS
ncbi:UNVERIFIED_CONTAM: hypothetical protein Sradi_3323700 [Sesamum radiatum]|uniref:Uncharacterized protein n=1 Tax=Sesamum radiatum TaxID=300843 RepID=A0AAW2R244_SESRA